MISFLLILLILFSIVFAFVWIWFFKNEIPSANELYKKALKAFKKRTYNKAKDLFLQIISLEPTFKDVEFKLAVCSFELGEDETAQSYLNNILSVSENNIDALIYLAKIMQKQGQNDKAEEFYTKALEEKNTNPECCLNLGIINYKKQDYEQSQEMFRKALKFGSKNKQIPHYITMCKAELCDFETKIEYKSIIKQYNKMVTQKNLPAEFDVSLAKVYAKTGQIDKALAACKKVLKTNAEDIEIYKILGLIQLIKKDFNEAKNTLSTALHLQPKSKDIHEILSYLLCQQTEDCERDKCRAKYYDMIQKFL